MEENKNPLTEEQQKQNIKKFININKKNFSEVADFLNGTNFYKSIFDSEHGYNLELKIELNQNDLLNNLIKMKTIEKTKLFSVELLFLEFFKTYNNIIPDPDSKDFKDSDIFKIYKYLFNFIKGEIDKQINYLTSIIEFKGSDNYDEIDVNNQNKEVYKFKIFILKMHINNLKDICKLLLLYHHNDLINYTDTKIMNELLGGLEELVEQVKNILKDVMAQINTNNIFYKDEYNAYNNLITDSVKKLDNIIMFKKLNHQHFDKVDIYLNGDVNYNSKFGEYSYYKVKLFYPEFFETYDEVIKQESDLFEIYKKLFTFIEGKIDKQIINLTTFEKADEKYKNNIFDLKKKLIV